MPKRGDICWCSQGFVGLITSTEPQEVEYRDGSKGMAWTGIHLEADKFGQPWSSRNPSVIDIQKILEDK